MINLVLAFACHSPCCIFGLTNTELLATGDGTTCIWYTSLYGYEASDRLMRCSYRWFTYTAMMQVQYFLAYFFYQVMIMAGNQGSHADLIEVNK